MVHRLLFVIAFLGSSAWAAEPKAAAPKAVFFELLKAYKSYPENFKTLSKGAETFDDVDPRAVERLPEKVLQARYRQFNTDYLNYRRLEKLTDEQLKEKQKRLDETPLSDLQNRGDLEIKNRALQDRQRQVRKLVFILSVEANSSILEALQTLPANLRVVENKAKGPLPKMPGVFGGSRADRAKMSESEKINLTPIDDEFYKTQLGKKLQADLGGKAEAWSYDFSADELYVLANGEVGKVRVKQESPGIRYIQTRVGSRFDEPTGRDAKVDLLEAKGRFLTGDAKEETLFGKMGPAGPAVLPEIPAGHSANDGHDHSH
ncbi:MAG: hypothetical protein JST16_06315 [Bdellovibrionales bacterium]|nr:hypothetical protein [Bdellovibrionales bacterium]